MKPDETAAMEAMINSALGDFTVPDLKDDDAHGNALADDMAETEVDVDAIIMKRRGKLPSVPYDTFTKWYEMADLVRRECREGGVIHDTKNVIPFGERQLPYKVELASIINDQRGCSYADTSPRRMPASKCLSAEGSRLGMEVCPFTPRFDSERILPRMIVSNASATGPTNQSTVCCRTWWMTANFEPNCAG